MKYKVVYLDSSLFDLADIKQYLDQHSEMAWFNLIDKMETQIGNLSKFPYIGVIYKKYRRLVCDGYLVFYKVDKKREVVEIIRILHSKRDIKSLIK